MINTRKLIAVLLCFILFCGSVKIGWEFVSLHSAKPAMVRNILKIDNTESAVDAVLSYATADFIGNHPVDESFLFWLVDAYGDDKLQMIARNTDFDDPTIWYTAIGKSIHVLWWEYTNAIGLAETDDGEVYVKEPGKETEIVLDFCGDLSMAEDVATTHYMEQQPDGLMDCFSKELLAEMRSADIFVLNNEFVYAAKGTPIEGKTYTFRGNPSYVRYLNDIGADLVTLANNHVFDYGEEGLIATLDALRDFKIPYIGAGRDIKEAAKPVYYIIGGRKIAIVNATQIERSHPFTQEATEDKPGVLKTLNSAYFVKVIAKAKKNADYCIVCVHWGTEGSSGYGADQSALANDFVHAGADAIVGGHTHCLQGIEYINKVPVWYSLGNFWFAVTSAMPADQDTGLARIRIQNDGNISYEFVPCRFSKGVTSLLVDPSEQRKSFDYLEKISRTTMISDDGVIHPKQ